MASRLDLQTKLENALGSENVYFQPPESMLISYPAIVYSLKNINKQYANNSSYLTKNIYNIMVIDTKQLNPVIDTILNMPFSSFERSFISDGLYHSVFTLYF